MNPVDALITAVAELIENGRKLLERTAGTVITEEEIKKLQEITNEVDEINKEIKEIINPKPVEVSAAATTTTEQAPEEPKIP